MGKVKVYTCNVETTQRVNKHVTTKRYHLFADGGGAVIVLTSLEAVANTIAGNFQAREGSELFYDEVWVYDVSTLSGTDRQKPILLTARRDEVVVYRAMDSSHDFYDLQSKLVQLLARAKRI